MKEDGKKAVSIRTSQKSRHDVSPERQFNLFAHFTFWYLFLQSKNTNLLPSISPMTMAVNLNIPLPFPLPADNITDLLGYTSSFQNDRFSYHQVLSSDRCWHTDSPYSCRFRYSTGAHYQIFQDIRLLRNSASCHISVKWQFLNRSLLEFGMVLA